MKIKVIGKQHLEGVSKKTGNAYNFNQVFYVGKAFGVEGEAGQSINLDSFDYPIDSIKVGNTYEVEYGPRGYVVSFVPAN